MVSLGWAALTDGRYFVQAAKELAGTGVTLMKMSNTLSDISATVEGLGFAVPSSRVVSVINDIIATGGFRGLPSIGIYVQETEFADGTPTR